MGKPRPDRPLAPTNYRELVGAIEAAGCQVDETSGGHPRVFRPNGTFLMCIPRTTSDYRGIRNAWSRFQRRLNPR